MTTRGSPISKEVLNISENYSDKSAEVTFVSSDNVVFKIHQKNLEICTGGFPPSDFKPQEGEMTPLSEDSATLELLFGFIYPNRRPKLKDTPTDLLFKFAEAAEKYEVYPAIDICHYHLKDIVEEEPLKVFLHAFKYDCSDLINKAAPFLHETPLTELLKDLPEALRMPWVLYHEAWRNSITRAFQDVVFTHEDNPVPHQCVDCEDDLGKITFKIFLRTPQKLSLTSVQAAVTDVLHQSKHLRPSAAKNLLSAIKEPPVFTTFLRS